jgi:peptide/nickel transport system substrate-binding protein
MVAAVVGAGLLVAACGTSPNAHKSSTGGVVTFAEAADTPPNYIAPMEPAAYFSINNLSQFAQDLYLPLYWFGNSKGEPVFNEPLSIAKAPVFSDNNTVATVTLKHWVWSNGQPITARDVMFWMNLLSAVTDPSAPTVGSSSAPGPGWGAAVPGGFPTNVVSYAETGTYSLVFHLNGSYNPTWYLYNELSQIYPMPQASWDELSDTGTVGNYDTSAAARSTIPGTTPTQYVPTNPGTGTSGALGVAQLINSQSQDLSTYTTNPLWKIVDGPFKMTEFTTSGFVKLVPNTAYSGSPKPTISAFEEEPFTSDSAEFDALRSGSVTIGYIPAQSLAQKSVLEKQEGYTYAPWGDFAIVFAPYNFTNPTVGPIFKQLYFRQALQSLVDQEQYIKQFSAGEGSVDNGPVPTFPKDNPDVSPLEGGGPVYPYDPTKAVALLKDNGWTVNAGGISVCSKPGTATGDCGAKITLGEQLSFKMLYLSGSTELTNEMEALQSALKAKAGISITLAQGPFAEVIGTAFGGCSYAKPCTDWEMADWGANVDWVYSPDYFPTGEELYATGASSNAGDYSIPTNDANIEATQTAPNQTTELKDLFKYEDYLAKQLPVVWMPNGPYQLTMYKSSLKGLTPQGVYDELYPQYFTLSS